jgi:hypothetical protein
MHNFVWNIRNLRGADNDVAGRSVNRRISSSAKGLNTSCEDVMAAEYAICYMESGKERHC